MSSITKVVKIIPKICECGQMMGHRQKDYEEALIKKQSLIENLTEEDKRLIELETFKDFFGMKMCCRTAFWNSDVPFIKSTNHNAFVDETGISSKNTKMTKKSVIKQGVIFIPSTPPPDFPEILNIEKKTEKIKKIKVFDEDELLDEI